MMMLTTCMVGFQKLLKSRASSSAQHDQEAKVTRNSLSSVNSVSASPSSASLFCSLSSSSSPSPSGTTPPTPLQPQSALSSLPRWSRKYDVLVCHSPVDSDAEEAGRLVSFLEASPRSLRCFLRHRDDCPGGAVSTELCQAVQNSHIWALLITPNFLQDDWCKYIMHQALAEGPMSNRIVPLLQNLPRSQYPRELKFYFFTDLSRNPSRGYALLNKTVLKYLEDLVKRQQAFDCSTDDSSNGLSGEEVTVSNTVSSSNQDKLMSKYDSTETSSNGSDKEKTVIKDCDEGKEALNGKHCCY